MCASCRPTYGPTSRPARSACDRSAARILVVDDTPENVRLLDAVLSPRGYTVDAVSSGAQALERLAEEPLPDLVLLDIVMPEDGRV